ncbi:primosomal protein N' [Nocardioides salsibiostraticola]
MTTPSQPGDQPGEQPEEQPELLPGLVRQSVAQSRAAAQAKSKATRAAKVAGAELATTLPVARVLVDVALAHLDRTFDYAVPTTMDAAAQPGVRVKVRFAGQDVDAYVVERVATSDHTGALTPLRRVVSDEPVLSPGVVALAGDVARRYAGVRSDVFRLAIPPRHATIEKQPRPTPSPAPLASADALAAASATWSGFERAEAFLGHLGTGAPRAVATVAPGDDWPSLIARAAAVAAAADRGVIVCLPDGKDVHRLDGALEAALGPDRHVCLTADLGPAERYRRFLAVSRGDRRVVVGTRSAAFAPVHDLGLVMIWDDGDDLHAEPRAPYPHTRETLLLRAERDGAAALLLGFARSVEGQHLLRTGWAAELRVPRQRLRDQARVTVAGATEMDLMKDPHAAAARIPRQVHQVIRGALQTGPVLVQTPRAGYAVALSCDRCWTPARCQVCTGPLSLNGPTDPPQCRWCGVSAPAWACPECGGRGLRAPVLGDARTAEELGRSFPSTLVLSSSGDRVRSQVDASSAIVVATPGAEPVAAEGYAAVVLLDGWLMLDGDGYRSAEETLRRWSNAVGLIRAGGVSIVVADPAHRAVQALVRWDHSGFAERETHERAEAHLPPASRLVTITGDPGAVDDVVTLLDRPVDAEILGPVRVDEGEDRVVVRVPRAQGGALSRALGEVQRVRSGRKLDAVRIRVDPGSL